MRLPLKNFAGLLLASIVLTSKENGTVSQTEFACAGKIYGYLRLPKTETGSHTLEGLWTAPNGKVVEHSDDALRFDPPGRSTAYVWFSFPDHPLMPGAIDPANDQQQLTYNGDWTLQVRWDGQSLLKVPFNVRCP